MPRWSADGGRIPLTLFEAAAFHRMVKVRCGCGHAAILQAHALWWCYARRGWDERIGQVGPRLRCGACGRRGQASVSLTTEGATSNLLPLPPIVEWKRAVNRFRN